MSIIITIIVTTTIITIMQHLKLENYKKLWRSIITYENVCDKSWAMFFFHIIEELIMYENDYYYPSKDTKEFLLILINHYVEILLI